MNISPTPWQQTVNRFLVAAIVAQWLALLGPSWVYIPPTAAAPAAYLSFADLMAISEVSATGLQAAFYQWIAWMFALVTTVIAIVAVRSRSTAAGLLCVAAGLVQVVVVLAVNGAAAPSLTAALQSVGYTRIGTVLFIGGAVLLIVAGVKQARSVPSAAGGRFGTVAPSAA
ncbi:hypothetical protein [Nocardia barduliensis]|uniref:hypothetical protein n=1 Tax=Nocardia barduliensis TaxID=2736643 RepID=UPI0015728EDB|nr:hypothetical protein [Nocardia barduliensis]